MTPWTAARQTSLSFTVSSSPRDSQESSPFSSVQFSSVAQFCLTLCNPMNRSTPGLPVHHQLLESNQTRVYCVSDVIQSSHPLLSLLLLPSIFSSIRVFSNELTLHFSGQSISASASVLPVNIQGWFPLGLTDWISLQSKGFSRVFSSTTVWRHQFFGTQHFLLSSSHIIHDSWKNHSFDYTDFCCKVISLLFNKLSGFVISFLLRSKYLLLWLQCRKQMGSRDERLYGE